MTATDATRATPVLVGPFDPRLRVAVAGWLAGFKPTTRASYTQAIDQWLAWCGQMGTAALAVERAHVDLWARHLEENRRLAPATVMHRLCVIRSFYRYCEDEDLVVRSPASRVRLPRQNRESSTHGMTRAEITRFLVASERNPTQHAMICLLTLNGLRISEACSINVDDLSFEYGHRTVRVARKGGELQTLPLSPKTARALDTAIGERTSGPLLLTAANTRMTRFNAGKIVARLGRRAGLPYRVHPHMLRHSFATTALDAGVPLHDVQDSMNHADPRTTMRYHRHRHSLDRNATHLVSAFLAAG